MNIVCEVTFSDGRSVADCRAVYYSATDHTVVWQRQGAIDVPLLEHPGKPEPDPHGGRNAYRLPGGVIITSAEQLASAGIAVVSYREKGCACGTFYKRYTPPDPLADPERHAPREHVR